LRKALAPNQSYTTNRSIITTVKGSLDDACARLVAHQDKYYSPTASEKSLPVVYNEYGHTWGNPSMDTIRPNIPLAKAMGAEYFVMDAGWYATPTSNWGIIGDWQVSRDRFPNGLSEFSQMANDAGMEAGIWFEFENVHKDSKSRQTKKDWLLTRGGEPVLYHERFFLDFRKPEVIESLKRELIPLIRDNGIKYIKLDYNAPIGIGADGAESDGEALRQHLIAVQDFYRYLKASIDGLVLEVCASGGLRTEPSWLGIGDMFCFSDAHCTRDASAIAANLHRVAPPKQLQVWSVLTSQMNESELVFTVVKSFFGRMCISGDLSSLSPTIFSKLIEGVRIYKKTLDVIRSGTSYLINNTFDDYRNIKGIQKFLRVSKDGGKAVAIINVFQGAGNNKITLNHPLLKGMKIDEIFAHGDTKAILNRSLTVTFEDADYCSCAILLIRK